jgi:hypothetical protein
MHTANGDPRPVTIFRDVSQMTASGLRLKDGGGGSEQQ